MDPSVKDTGVVIAAAALVIVIVVVFIWNRRVITGVFSRTLAKRGSIQTNGTFVGARDLPPPEGQALLMRFPFTYTGWFLMRERPAAKGAPPLFAIGTQTVTERSIEISRNGIRTDMPERGAYEYLVDLPLNEWINVTWTSNGEVEDVFVNGTLVGSSSIFSPWKVAGTRMIIGAPPGSLNQVALFDEYLTRDKARELYDGAINESKLRALWNFDKTLDDEVGGFHLLPFEMTVNILGQYVLTPSAPIYNNDSP